MLKMSFLREIAVFLSGCVFLTKLCVAQVPMLGPCPNVKAMTNFEPTKYLGKWYEAERYFFIFEVGGKCVSAYYTDQGHGRIGVKNTNINVLNGGRSTIEGYAISVSDTEAKLEVHFPSVPGNFGAPYWVVETDYTSYALVWSCNDFSLFHTSTSWILTRARNPHSTVIENAYAAANKNHITRELYMKTDQKNCPKDV